jgi:ABC-type branched-subunit amino acid transport system substrate-binding protein
MARGTRRIGTAFLVLALTMVGLSTATSAAPRQAGGGTDTGLTAKEMNVSLLYGDTTQLEQAGILAKIGDRKQHFTVAADAANKAGGAAGRQLVVTNATFPVPSTATDERTACLKATEDDNAFIVILAGNQTEETIRCITEEHKRIALAVAANTRPVVYAASGGRLFTNDPNTARLMKMWVTALKKKGTLKGKTLGIVRPDDSTHADVAKALTAELKKAGFKVAEEVALPCAGSTSACEQNDIGAQKLQTAGVDALFSLLNALANPAFVGAADSIGYKPHYLASDYEYQVYDTTAKLFGDQKQAYNGTVGMGTSVATPTPDAPRTACNKTFTDATGTTEKPLSDAWSDIGTMCGMVDRIVQASNAAEKAGGLTQKSFIRQYEKLTIAEGNRKGEWGPKKHDAYDTYQLFQFSAACTCWKPLKGTIGSLKG